MLHGIPKNPFLATVILYAASLTIIIALISKITTTNIEWELGMLSTYLNPHTSLLSQYYYLKFINEETEEEGN